MAEQSEPKPEARPRSATGQFLKGQPSPEGVRRKAGSLNKITSDIKQGVIAGLARHGSNGRGEGGFAGFCFFLAKKHPKAAARIVEKLLPLQLNASGAGLVNSIGVVNIVSVPSDRYLGPEDLARARPPLLIDQTNNDADVIENEQTNTPRATTTMSLDGCLMFVCSGRFQPRINLDKFQVRYTSLENSELWPLCAWASGHLPTYCRHVSKRQRDIAAAQ